MEIKTCYLLLLSTVEVKAILLFFLIKIKSVIVRVDKQGRNLLYTGNLSRIRHEHDSCNKNNKSYKTKRGRNNMSDTHNIAILIANGFNEKELVEIQKSLRAQDMVPKMVSSENGVVNGWADNTWGCFFPVDVSINQALASDFDGLIIMGGDKSIQRLAKTAHTNRFVSSFQRVEKPVLALDEASQIIDTETGSVTHLDVSEQDLTETLTTFINDVQVSEPEMELSIAA
tara:strand:+ start:159 stop:845 length:687 start_codon:yes stop_codon:yes gene_type:complete